MDYFGLGQWSVARSRAQDTETSGSGQWSVARSSAQGTEISGSEQWSVARSRAQGTEISGLTSCKEFRDRLGNSLSLGANSILGPSEFEALMQPPHGDLWHHYSLRCSLTVRVWEALNIRRNNSETKHITGSNPCKRQKKKNMEVSWRWKSQNTKSSGRQVAHATKFCAVVPDVCGYSALNLLYWNLRRLLDFENFVGPCSKFNYSFLI
jgi:hypothetical protein